jgi:quercetin dioxygenase-like cupin family protein
LPPAPGHAQGFSGSLLVGREVGSVHTDLSANTLEPGGWVAVHLHSYESAFYVLSGHPRIFVDRHWYQLSPGDFCFVPVGYAHGWHNAGVDRAEWLTLNTPQRLPAGAGRLDTFFASASSAARFPPGEGSEAQPPHLGAPTQRWFGHYEGTPPQDIALRLADPARGRAPAGMDTALLAYSGISVKMMVDRNLGAELLTMFMVDYEPGGAAQAHDHPFEEAYFFLAGEIEAEFEGHHYHLRAGDVAWAGVGAAHAFYNEGTGRVRWVETQAPQPPGRHSYRWVEPWRRLGASPEWQGAETAGAMAQGSPGIAARDREH